MKPLLLAAIVLLSGWALGGCGGLPPAIATGSGVELTPDGLSPLVHSGFARAWVRSGSSFAKYDRVHVLSGEFSYRRPPRSSRAPFSGFLGNDFALPAGMKTDLEASFRSILETEITRDGELQSVDEGGAGVLLVRAIVGDLVVHAPLETLGGDNLFWIDSVGEITLLVEFYDWESRELIGRLLERRALERGYGRYIRATVGEATFEANRVFQDWAKRLRWLLHAMKKVDLAA